MNSDILGFLLYDPGYPNAHWMSLKSHFVGLLSNFRKNRQNIVRRGYVATGSEQMCIAFVVWPWSLSIKCIRNTIIRLRHKSIFIKLFKTADIETVKYCQNIFRFELPVRLSRLKTRFLALYCTVRLITQFVDTFWYMVDHYVSVDIRTW